MKEKLDSATYLTIFAVSFIGFLIAFFLGVWVGGKATLKPEKTKFQEKVNFNDDFNPAYEEIGQKHKDKPDFQTDNSKKEDIKKTASGVKKSEEKKLTKKEEIVNPATKKAKKQVTSNTSKPLVKKRRMKSVQKTKTVKEQRYMLQIGAFKRLKDAEKLKSRFESKGYSVFIVKEKGKKSVFYKVRIGTFYSKKIAYKVKRKIEREGKIKVWLVPIK